ncbi:MAG TPA: hypothetical protein VLB44_08265 [Kofleriaceae bacterium]|nr:hypothetical protein [Kofleriaceae bacterium]
MTRAATQPSAVLMMCVAVTCAFAPACDRHRAEPGPDLQVVGESVRLRSTDPVPSVSPMFDGTTIRLVAARGETVALQVLHRAPGPVSLVGDVPVRSYAVERVTVKRGSTNMYGGGRGAGDYPDVLVADPAPVTDPAFFEIDVPRDASATHALNLQVGTRLIPVEIRVANVELPPLLPRVWAYYDPRELSWANLGAGTHDAPSAEERACIAMFRRYGVMLSPDLPRTAWPARRDLLAGFPFIPVKLDLDHAADDVRGWIAATQGSGQVPFAIPIDEPRSSKARARVRALAQTIRQVGGGPGRFLFAVTDEPRSDYGDLVDLYITLAPKRSDSFPRWTYNGAPPLAGSLVVDAAPPGPRTWGWLAWRWNIAIWYVWDALYWHDRHNRKDAPLPGRALDLAHDATSFDDGDDHGNLDGVLALPGDATTPCRPTLRLAAIRRGMQDRALLELASRCHPAQTQALVDRLVPRALGEAPQHGSPAWPTDDAAWERAREKLLELAACR